MKKRICIILFIIMNSMIVIGELDLGDSSGIFVDITPPFNFSALNVNSSDFWDDLDNETFLFLPWGNLLDIPSYVKDWTPDLETINTSKFNVSGGKFTDHVKSVATICDSNNCIMSNSSLNETIDARFVSTTYLPTSFSLEDGTPAGGNNLGNLSFDDEETFNITEGVGANPLELLINFSGVANAPDFITMSHQYTGTHEILLQLWDYDTSDWETYDTITSQAELIKDNIAIVDGNNHVSGELVQARFIHVQTGNPSHELFIDFINIIDGFSTLTTSEHDGLSGRDNFDTNHFLYADHFRLINDSIMNNETINNAVGNNSNYWHITGSDLFYKDGNVAIGTEDTTEQFTINDSEIGGEVTMQIYNANTDSDSNSTIELIITPLSPSQNPNPSMTIKGLRSGRGVIQTDGIDALYIDNNQQVEALDSFITGGGWDNGGCTMEEGNLSCDNVISNTFIGQTYIMGTVVHNNTATFYDLSGIPKVNITALGDSYFNGGNVGIGTITPDVLLDIEGGSFRSTVSGTPTGTFSSAFHLSRAGAISIILDDNNNDADKAMWQIQNTDNLLKFRSLTDIGGAETDNILVLNRSGNIGMGLSDPRSDIEIRKSASDNISIYMGSANDRYWRIGHVGLDTAPDWGRRPLVIEKIMGSNTGDIVAVLSGGSGNMLRIVDGGLQLGTGINYGFDALTTEQFNISARASNNWQIRADAFAGNEYDFGINFNRGAFAGDFYIKNNNDNKFNINLTSGLTTINGSVILSNNAERNIGVPTDTDIIQLSAGGILVNGNITLPTVDSASDGIIFNGGVSDGINSRVDGTLSFMTNDNERIRIDDNGNMGIGTITPNKRMTVLGETNTTSLNVTNDAQIGNWLGVGLVPSVALDVNGEISFLDNDNYFILDTSDIILNSLNIEMGDIDGNGNEVALSISDLQQNILLNNANLTLGDSTDHRSGITMYDQNDGSAHCLVVVANAIQLNSGDCN